MDMRFKWLRAVNPKSNFDTIGTPALKIWADYNTKHHPDIYHETHRITHAGI